MFISSDCVPGQFVLSVCERVGFVPCHRSPVSPLPAGSMRALDPEGCAPWCRTRMHSMRLGAVSSFPLAPASLHHPGLRFCCLLLR